LLQSTILHEQKKEIDKGRCKEKNKGRKKWMMDYKAEKFLFRTAFDLLH